MAKKTQIPPDPFEWASSLVGRRDHSIKELQNKMAKKGFTKQQITDTCERMLDLKWLDDRRYAESFIREHITYRGFGPFAIRFKLREKGVEEAIIDQLLEELADPQILLESAKKLVQKKALSVKDADPRKRRYKLYTYLMRRGFSEDTVRLALDEMEY